MSDLPAVRTESLVTRIMLDPEYGKSAYAMAETFSNSQLVPRHLQGKPADCFIVLTMAAELRQNPLMVAQNIVIVSGTAGWKAAYVIAMANASGILRDRIDWIVERTGERTEYQRKTKEGSVKASMENMKVTAFATLAGTGARVEFSVDTAMAIGEGWANNEKYVTMPEVMLRYRAGAFLVRFYAADVMLGMYTDMELETIPAERGEVTQPIPAASPSLARITAAGRANEPAPEVREREVIEVEAEPAAKPPKAKARPDDQPGSESDIQRAIDAAPTAGLTMDDLIAHVGGAPSKTWTVGNLRALSTLIRETRDSRKAAPVGGDEDGA